MLYTTNNSINQLNRFLDQYIAAMLKGAYDDIGDLLMYRQYADGEHPPQLSDDQRERLGKENDYTFNPTNNICPTIIEAKANKLKVIGLAATLPDEPELSEELTAYINDVWEGSGFDVRQFALAYVGIRDGDAYIICDWNPTSNMPQMYFNTKYDGVDGAFVYYKDPLDASSKFAGMKTWLDDSDPVLSILQDTNRRLTIYYADRIERFMQSARGWQPYLDDGATLTTLVYPGIDKTYEAGVYWLTDDGTPNGTPLGMPIFHFPHLAFGTAGGTSVLRSVVPTLQDIINLSTANLIAAALLAGFSVNWATGFNPANDKLTIFPASMIYMRDTEGTFGQLPAADLTQLIEVVNHYIKTAAQITSTPLTFFNVSGQIPAEGTMETIQEALISAVKQTQGSLGWVYTEAIKYCLRLQAVYGSVNGKLPWLTMNMIDTMNIEVQWAEPLQRDPMREIEKAIAKVSQLHIPLSTAWQELGYNAEQIAAMLDDNAGRRAEIIAAINTGAATATNNPERIGNALRSVDNGQSTSADTEGLEVS